MPAGHAGDLTAAESNLDRRLDCAFDVALLYRDQTERRSAADPLALDRYANVPGRPDERTR